VNRDRVKGRNGTGKKSGVGGIGAGIRSMKGISENREVKYLNFMFQQEIFRSKKSYNKIQFMRSVLYCL
jgi:hypothetical protein